MQVQIRSRGIAAVVGTALLMFSGVANAQELDKGEVKCVNSINKGASKVSKAQGKALAACIKFGGKGKPDKLGPAPSTIESCLTNDVKGKVAKAIGKIKTSDCPGGAAPSFLPGLETSSSGIGDIMKKKDLDLIHAIFGTDLDVFIVDAEVDKPGAECQAAIAKAVGKCQDTKLKLFNKCKKNKLKAGETDIEACLGTGTESIDDPDQKIPGKCGNGLGGTVGKKCVGTDNDALFPPCAGQNLGDCLEQKIECEVCQALNALDGLNRNCDLFDDGTANESCGCESSFDCREREACMAQAGRPAVCECLPPFTGPVCNECAAGYTGPDCTSCDPGFVSNRLENANDDDEIQDLTNPEHFLCVPDVTESCAGRACSGHGTCQVLGRDAVCACDEGHTGRECEECAPDYERDGGGFCVLGQMCRDAKCGAHGDCRATAFGDITCECDAGFSGVDCGGPDLAIATDAETFTLYDGESIVVTPEGGDPPYAWEVLEGPARVMACSGLGSPGCPAGGAQIIAVAPGLETLELVKITLTDGSGNSASDDLAVIPPTFLPFTGDVHPELKPFYRAMLSFMRARGVRAGALAISKGGKIVGANGYGYRNAGIDADPFVNAGEGPGPLVQPSSPFRLASVSKTLTAAAVRQAATDAGVNINSSTQPNRAATFVQQSIGFDLTSGAPSFDYNLAAPLTTDARWADIQIRHLLNHHAGFLRDTIPTSTTGQPAWNANRLPFTEDLNDQSMLQTAQWGASSQDLTYGTMYILAALKRFFDPRPTVEDVIRFAAGTLLNYNPGGTIPSDPNGQKFDNYSNLGYILLGRVLEGLKGKTYDPDEPGVPSGWGAFPKLVQDYLCEAADIQDGVFPGDAFNPQPFESYYRDIDWHGNENRAWNMAEGSDKIRFNQGIQQWQFCQSNCPSNGAVWNQNLNTPAAFGGVWLAERNSAGGMLASAPALLKFARVHRVKVGTPGDGGSGIGSLLPAPGAHATNSSHSGSIVGTRTLLWQMAGNRTNRLPFPAVAWNPDPTAPLNLDMDGQVLINEGTIGSNCNLPSDVVVAFLINQRQDRRAPRSNVAPKSTSSNSNVYQRITDFLANAACQVDNQGWPDLSDNGPVIALPCP